MYPMETPELKPQPSMVVSQGRPSGVGGRALGVETFHLPNVRTRLRMKH